MSVSSTIPVEQIEREDLRALIADQLKQDNLDLPLLPVVANQVLMFSHDPNGNAYKLSTLIQQDQALASKILHMANSPAYLPQSSIVSLHQAIAWLGLNLLGSLAFSISVQKRVFTIKGYEKEVRTLWRQALATGLYGKEIARRIRLNVENAFLCGLLHTIGKPLLLHLLFTARHLDQGRLSWELLEPLIHEWHIPAGAKLAEAWKLPGPVREAICLYSDQTVHMATSPTKGAMITCLADHLGSWLLDPSSYDEETLRSLPIVQALNFYPEDMTALFEQREIIQYRVDAFLV
jgi:HD-like signal output (HDOD) protein